MTIGEEIRTLVDEEIIKRTEEEVKKSLRIIGDRSD